MAESTPEYQKLLDEYERMDPREFFLGSSELEGGIEKCLKVANELITDMRKQLNTAHDRNNKLEEAHRQVMKYFDDEQYDTIKAEKMYKISRDILERDWREDFTHENGNYMNVCSKCGETFKGHKRRTICKICK